MAILLNVSASSPFDRRVHPPDGQPSHCGSEWREEEPLGILVDFLSAIVILLAAAASKAEEPERELNMAKALSRESCETIGTALGRSWLQGYKTHGLPEYDYICVREETPAGCREDWIVFRLSFEQCCLSNDFGGTAEAEWINKAFTEEVQAVLKITDLAERLRKDRDTVVFLQSIEPTMLRTVSWSLWLTFVIMKIHRLEVAQNTLQDWIMNKTTTSILDELKSRGIVKPAITLDLSSSMPYQELMTGYIETNAAFVDVAGERVCDSGEAQGRGACFVATVVCTERSAVLTVLRRYRDNVLIDSLFGRLFLALYSLAGPGLAGIVSRFSCTKAIGRTIVVRLAWRLRKFSCSPNVRVEDVHR